MQGGRLEGCRVEGGGKGEGKGEGGGWRKRGKMRVVVGNLSNNRGSRTMNSSHVMSYMSKFKLTRSHSY